MKSAKNIWSAKNLIKILKENGVVVMPTDTLYGIVGRAENKKTVEQIYKLRQRNSQKPCVILISDWSEAKKFGIVLTLAQKNKIKKYKSASAESSGGTRPTSYILDCPDAEFKYLHRDTKTLAFRVPNISELKNLLRETGPLIAPSANLEARPPSKTISEAKKYFGSTVDLYVDGGIIEGKASKIIKLHKNGSTSVIRE